MSHFIQCVGYRGDAGVDDANRKALGNAVDLLPKSGLKPLAGKPDLDEWPLAESANLTGDPAPSSDRQVGQTHIASLWEAKKGNWATRSGYVQTTILPRRGSQG